MDPLAKLLIKHNFTPQQVLDVAEGIGRMSKEEQAEFAEMFARLDERERLTACQENFMPFVKRMWPNFIEGRHHAIMAEAFDRIAAGTLKRLIINMPPRHSKSEFGSYLLPAWYLGRFPDRKIIQTSHTADLAVGFGRKVRNLVGSPEYQEVFPDVKLSADSKAAGRWNTNKKGDYFAIGVGGAVTGKGADLCVHPDTRVLTPRGWVRASQILPGDRLMGLGERGWEFGRVLHCIDTKSDTEIVVNGKARVTPNHPIWTENRGWVKAKDLIPGDLLRRYTIIGNLSHLLRKVWVWIRQSVHGDHTLANTTSGR